MNRHMLVSLHRPLTALALSLLAPVALAFDSEAGNPILDRFSFDIGSYFYGSGTTVTLNGQFGELGVPVDLEHDLGFTSVNRFRIDGYWRITKHQRLRFMYFQADRERTKTLQRTIQYGDYTYPVSASVSATNKVSVAGLTWEYDFFVRDHISLGANIGIHNLDFKLGLSGAATGPNGTRTPEAAQTGSVSGPLPMIGLAGIFSVNPWFYFTADLAALKVTVNPYSGSLTDFGGTAVWQPFRHFALGAGYDFFKLSASVDAHRYNGNLDWRYSGPRVFFTASF